MPLGFGRSILSKPAVAAAPSGVGNYYHSSTATNNSVFAAPVFGNNTTAWSDTDEMTWMVWFRGYLAGDYETGDVKGDSCYMPRFGWTPSLDGFYMGWGQGPFDSGNSTEARFELQSKSNLYGNAIWGYPSNALVPWDGAWHQMIFLIDNANNNHRLWLDGSEKTTSDGFSTAFDVSTIDWFCFNGYVSNPSPGTGNPTLGTVNANTVDIGPSAVWFSDIDPATNLSAMYDSGNTDGYVDMGSDGTASGLTQPDVWSWITDGGTVTQGGASTATVVELSVGGATLTKVTDGTGPGSGDTRTAH